jgi:hypothetical protein
MANDPVVDPTRPLLPPDFRLIRSMPYYDARHERTSPIGERYSMEPDYNEGTHNRMSFFTSDHARHETPSFAAAYTQHRLALIRAAHNTPNRRAAIAGLSPQALLNKFPHLRREDVETFWLRRRFGDNGMVFNRYLQANGLSGAPVDHAWLRYVGLVPPEPRGMVLDFPGFNRNISFHPERADDFLKRGYAYFTMDRLGEGSSSPWDVTNSELGDARLHTMHAMQFIYESHRLGDDKIQALPLFAVGTELGGLSLLDAMMTYPGHGIQAAFIDDPLLARGSQSPVSRALAIERMETVPEDWPTRLSELYLGTPHPRISGRGPDRISHIHAYHSHRVGARNVPLPYAASVDAYGRAVTERLLISGAGLPSIMLGYSAADNTTGGVHQMVRGDVALGAMVDSGIATYVRPTILHDSFDNPDDVLAMADVDDFFRGRLGANERVLDQDGANEMIRARQIRGIEGASNLRLLGQRDRELRNQLRQRRIK